MGLEEAEREFKGRLYDDTKQNEQWDKCCLTIRQDLQACCCGPPSWPLLRSIYREKESHRELKYSETPDPHCSKGVCTSSLYYFYLYVLLCLVLLDKDRCKSHGWVDTGLVARFPLGWGRGCSRVALPRSVVLLAMGCWRYSQGKAYGWLWWSDWWQGWPRGRCFVLFSFLFIQF